MRHWLSRAALLFTLTVAASVIISGCANETTLEPGETPESKEKIYRSYLQERLAKLSDKQIRVQVSLAQYLKPDEFETLLLSSGVISLEQVTIWLPRIKYHTSLQLDSHPPKGIDFQSLVIADASIWDNMTAATIIAEVKTAPVQIRAFRALVPANEALRWWNENSDYVRFIQSILNEFDKVQKAFYPGEEL